MASSICTDVAAVMVPLAEYGHQTALLRLSRVISSYEIPVHYATTAAGNHQLKLRLLDWKLDQFPNLHFHDLSPPSDYKSSRSSSITVEELEAEKEEAVQLYRSTLLLRESLCSLCHQLSSTCKKLVIIHDSFMTESVQALLHQLTTIPVETYIFHGFPALTLYSWIQQVTPNYDDEGLLLPLKPHIPPIDIGMHRYFFYFVELVRDWAPKCSGQIINTCRELEGPYIDALAKQSGKLVWGLGPLNPLHVPHDDKNNVRHKCIEWLDKQPKQSVVFVSFGTATTLTPEEINELAIGLEQCEHKFIWVLSKKDKMGNALTTGSTPELELPTGFEERVADRGLIIRDWAPQLEILAHPSTGCYLFHSGGGSFFESITMGVPMVTWPMHSDNPYNDVLVTKALKVGVSVKDWEHRDEKVTSEKIANALKTVMNSPEGEEIRQRAIELSKAIKNSLSEGGTTHKLRESFIAHITRKSEDEETPN